MWETTIKMRIRAFKQKSKRLYGLNGLFFRNAEYGLKPPNILIYRELQILLLTIKTTRSMKKFMNVLAIFANIAIITGLVTDTINRVGSKRRESLTNSSHDETRTI